MEFVKYGKNTGFFVNHVWNGCHGNQYDQKEYFPKEYNLDIGLSS